MESSNNWTVKQALRCIKCKPFRVFNITRQHIYVHIFFNWNKQDIKLFIKYALKYVECIHVRLDRKPLEYYRMISWIGDYK